jgi:eukaryotic-like serine/threonine-protein kinase
MTPERWRRVEELYHAALGHDERERAAFLAEASGDDEEVRGEVESLLAQSTDRFLAEPAMAVVAAQMTRPAAASLLTGRRLGTYDVQALLGAGGMGQVYRARDTRLGREVALKILPREVAADPERLTRFEREARLLASLNHPHIAAIYGIEEGDGVPALVLELVEGETLAGRLQRGPVPIPDAVTIARQIADALEAAHERGIIHRDLKPANVKITPDGAVKVLDFGLAKVVVGDGLRSDLVEAPIASIGGTREGILLGTAAYMSPEQARGQPVDRRTDIWAFGCVLFELLTGQLTFAGDTVSDTIAAVIQREPDWTTLPASTPPPVRRLLVRCLDKDPKRRLRDIGDARLELDEALVSPSPSAERPSGVVTRRTAIAALAGAAAGTLATGLLSRGRVRGGISRGLTRFSIPVPDGQFIPAFWSNRLAIAPDGRLISFSTRNGTEHVHFYIHSLSDLESRLVKDVVPASPFFSPDRRWLGYFTATPPSLRKMPLDGGAPITIFRRDAATGNSGATWADGDTIYFVAELPGGLMSVPAGGGQPTEILRIETSRGERTLKYPSALPGGGAVLYTVAKAESESFDDAHIAVFSPRTGQRKVLVEGGTHPRYSPSGHVVYARNGSLLAVPFDPDRLEVTGQPVTVVEGVLMSRNTGAANFDVSSSGDLAYVPGICEGGARTLCWVDRSGHAESLSLAARSYLHPRISPDARRLAIEIEGANHDCYVYDFASGVLSNITADGVSHWPLWSSDGQRIGYRSGSMGHFRLWQVPADRSRAPEQVLATGFSQNAESYSPDGRVMAYTATEPDAPSKVIMVRLEGDRTPQPLDDSTYAEGSPKFSPDGHWVAYCSTESGKPQVYVRAFPGPGPKLQVSNDSGTDPVWKRQGGELFFRNGDSMMVVPISTASGFTAGRPLELWKGHFSHGTSSSCGPPGFSSSNYDVTADGTRFLMIKDEDLDTARSTQIIVVLGWSDEVRRMSAGA